MVTPVPSNAGRAGVGDARGFVNASALKRRAGFFALKRRAGLGALSCRVGSELPA